jgi:hypothetical protein
MNWRRDYEEDGALEVQTVELAHAYLLGGQKALADPVEAGNLRDRPYHSSPTCYVGT